MTLRAPHVPSLGVLRMRQFKYMQNVLIGATAVAFAGARFVPGAEKSGPVVPTEGELTHVAAAGSRGGVSSGSGVKFGR